MGITAGELKHCRTRPVMFADGAQGLCMQLHQCVEHPRLLMAWRCGGPSDPTSAITYVVDGLPVKDLEEAARRLNESPATVAGGAS